MRARILSILMMALMLVSVVPTWAMAATFEEVNQNSVFLTQERNGTCTLASTAMMLRRTAMMRGDQDWQSITEASCREAFWIGGRGLPYKFQYDGMKVSHGRLPGGEANRQILIDMLAQEKAWTINLGELSAMETLLTIHAVEEDGVIKGDYTTYAEGPMGTFSFYHVADDAQFKTDIDFTMELGEEYLTAHPTEEAFHLAIGYVCDYARNGVDFTGKETVTVGFNDVKVVLVGDIATSDPAESIMAGTVVRPAALDDAAFANWFVSAYNSLNSFLANLIMSLPESVLTLLIQTGMFG